MKVKELLHAVGKKCGVDPYMIDHMDLENIVERVVAIREGREPPPDLNEDPVPSKEPNPPSSSETSDDEDESSDDERPPTPPSTQPPLEFIIRQPVFHTISSNSTKDFKPPSFDGNFVAIDMEISDEFTHEQALNWEEPMVIGRSDEQLVRRDYLTSPEQLRYDTPVVLVDTRNNEPRRFKEKKKKYGRDPKRLHATYQEEWERLERLGTKLGPRRKSLLALQDVSAASTNTQEAQLGEERLRFKKKRRSVKKRAAQNGNVALPTSVVVAAANASFIEKPALGSATANIFDKKKSRDVVHRLSVGPLMVEANREGTPSSTSSAGLERRKSLTPGKLSPLLLKKFDALIEREKEMSSMSPPTSVAAKRGIMMIPNGSSLNNNKLETHVKLGPTSSRMSPADVELTADMPPDGVSNSTTMTNLIDETQPAGAQKSVRSADESSR